MDCYWILVNSGILFCFGTKAIGDADADIAFPISYTTTYVITHGEHNTGGGADPYVNGYCVIGKTVSSFTIRSRTNAYNTYNWISVGF